MKCEICHKKDAETALAVERDGEEDELYVCKECARAERVKRQKKSQRTRKITGPGGVEMSVTEIHSSCDGEEPPPFIAALMHAMDDMVGGIAKAAQESKNEPEQKPEEPEYKVLPTERAESAFRIGPRLHLEALNLIGELEAVQRAVRALELRLEGVDADGVRDAGHAYRLLYTGSPERAKRVAEDLLAQERNARVRLFEEMPRVFADALCRALAILKNCRLLSPGELYDLLSPLRLAALEKMLDGLTLKDVEKMLSEIRLDSREDDVTQDERDRIDAERADAMNARFEDVMLNETAEGRFL